MLALEDGFRLHRLIDPETTPADSFLRAISDLQRSMGIVVGLMKNAQPAPPCTLCICPATARILRGDACQIAIADSTLTAIPIAKAMV